MAKTELEIPDDLATRTTVGCRSDTPGLHDLTCHFVKFLTNSTQETVHRHLLHRRHELLQVMETVTARRPE